MPMGWAMAISILASALRHARDSWRGQLALLLVGALVASVVETIGVAQGFVLPAAMLALVAAAVRAAARQPTQVAVFAPRLASQLVLALAPVALVGLATLQLASSLEVVGLLLIVVMFPLAIASALVALLATTAVVRGDRDWMPRVAMRVLRVRPLGLLGAFIVGCVALALVAVPVMLVGFVLTSLLGPLGMIGLGIASAAVVPLTGCWALAAWKQAGGEEILAASAAAAAAATVARAEAAPDLAAAFGLGATPWVAGPSWNAQLQPGAPWGTWVQLPAASEVALQVSWSGSLAPQLAIGREDGTWTVPIQLVEPGALVPMMLLAGNSYLQLTGFDPGVQAIAVVLHARASAAA
jgi:hypothetical protein